MVKRRDVLRVLAIDPTPKGFGFIILESPGIVVDWGARSARAASIVREQQLMLKVEDLLWRYRPHVVILEDTSSEGARRCGRVKLLIATVANHAMWKGISVRKVPASKVREVFTAFGAKNKYQIACAISKQLPEIAVWLPQPRKIWMGEDYRMCVFDAAAFALTYFYTRSR